MKKQPVVRMAARAPEFTSDRTRYWTLVRWPASLQHRVPLCQPLESPVLLVEMVAFFAAKLPGDVQIGVDFDLFYVVNKQRSWGLKRMTRSVCWSVGKG